MYPMHVKRNDLNAKSRMKGDFHVRFRERLRVKFPWSTRQNAIRPITLGRKNYLFCGDHQAAVSMSVVCSLLATCKAHKVNPRTYLNDVIARMPYMQKANYEELLQMLPHKWKEKNKE